MLGFSVARFIVLSLCVAQEVLMYAGISLLWRAAAALRPLKSCLTHSCHCAYHGASHTASL